MKLTFDTLVGLIDKGRVRRAASVTFGPGRGDRLRFRWWFLPLLTLVLAIGGWVANSSLESSLQRQKAAELETLLDADLTALGVWFDSEKSFASVIAADPNVRRLVVDLTAMGAGAGARERLLSSAALADIRNALRPLARARGYIDFVISGAGGLVLAAATDAPIGNPSLTRHVQFLAPALGGIPMVSRPFRAEIPLPDESGQLAWGRPTMFVAAPVRDVDGDVIAALGMRIRPEVDFTRILSVARVGESGETYAFDAEGLMVSQSRFDSELRQIGLLPPDLRVRAILNVELRDPGGDLARGFVPELPHARQPLTRMAAAATRGESGVDVAGYRDYRGAEVIGAWRWLDDYGFGVATEVNRNEAYRLLDSVRVVFRIVFGLFALASLGVLVSTVVIARVAERADRAVARAKKLGQYTLEERIGAGGMGEVYRARHAMLRRPTAIKLLSPGRSSERDLVRFEREVQVTAQLTHPNTVAIYDFGRTPEGVFYYVMEYLPGFSIDRLVEIGGPLPAARVIHLLTQVCGSLAEAHAAGLIHRDVKPPNIIVCERGGVADVAKVLDFGIAKEIGDERSGTQPGGFAGTPHFMAPEALRGSAALDARCDIYSLGAVAFYALWGRPVFDGATAAEVAAQHLRDDPGRPSNLAGVAVPPTLQALVLRCLAKDPAVRPQDMGAMEAALRACAGDAGAWTPAMAGAWWTEHASLLGAPPPDRPARRESAGRDQDSLQMGNGG